MGRDLHLREMKPFSLAQAFRSRFVTGITACFFLLRPGCSPAGDDGAPPPPGEDAGAPGMADGSVMPHDGAVADVAAADAPREAGLGGGDVDGGQQAAAGDAASDDAAAHSDAARVDSGNVASDAQADSAAAPSPVTSCTGQNDGRTCVGGTLGSGHRVCCGGQCVGLVSLEHCGGCGISCLLCSPLASAPQSALCQESTFCPLGQRRVAIDFRPDPCACVPDGPGCAPGQVCRAYPGSEFVIRSNGPLGYCEYPPDGAAR